MTNPPELPQAPGTGLSIRELHAQDEALLQGFFDDNPAYFLSTAGAPARPCEAHEELHGTPPAGFSYGRQWVLGWADAPGSLQAMAQVVSDLFAQRVWHIGLFIVATARHGTGDAQRIHRGVEQWMVANGAQWLRLGVVQGNARAERFWQAQGCTEVRQRHGVVMGKRTKTLRVMVKPLAGQPMPGALQHYLQLVPRDRPEPSPAVP